MSTLRPAAGGLFTDGRRLLRAAALITGVNGPGLPGTGRAAGGPAGTGPRAVGAFLLLYAVAMGAVSTPARIRRGAAPAVVEINLLWTVLSVTAAAAGWPAPNPAGRVWAPLQAAVVAGFAAVQYAALRRTR